MDVGALHGFCLELGSFFVLLFDSVDFLLLDIHRCNLHSQNDVLDFALSQTGNIDVVLLSIVCKNQVFEFNLNLDPLLVAKVWPDVMRKSDSGLIWLKDDLRSFSIQMQSSQNQNESAESCERLDGLQPIVIKVEKEHLWLSCFQDSISKLLNLEACLERQLQFTTLDDNVREVKQMDFKRVEHALSGNNDLLRLFFNWQTSNECCYFFSSLPFSKLSESLLTCPNTGMYNLQKELTSSRVKDEDSTIDGFCCQISFKGLMNSDSIHICIIDKPNDLV